MSTVLITQGIWPELTKAARESQTSCDVAVAYFGAGASRLLPLPKNSHLVVDASERAVMSGQTCPTDLTKLVKKRVKVYSVPNLHAKVFVLGRTAYIGSVNVSSRSAKQLIEAVVRTKESGVVRAAKQFVRDNCLLALTPSVLNQLAKLYRPPHVPGENKGKRVTKDTSRRPTLPRLLLAQLHREVWPDRDQTLHDRALPVAKKRRKHPRSFELDSFRYTGKCPFKRGDVVIQVTDEAADSVLVDSPGNVLHVRTRHDGNRQVSFVYLERPARRRRQLKVMARALGRGSLKRLRRQGLIRDSTFVQAMLRIWAN